MIETSLVGSKLSIVIKGTKEDYEFEGELKSYETICDVSCMVLSVNDKDVFVPTSAILFITILVPNEYEVKEQICMEAQ